MVKYILIMIVLVTSISIFSAFGDSPGFTNAITISNNGENSTAPQLIVSGNNVYVGWISNKANDFGISFTKSSDGGISFGKPISFNNLGAQGADHLDMVESNGTIYAVWQSFSSGSSTIYFTKSNNGGTNFDTPIELSEQGKDSAFPQIAIFAGHVFAVWLERGENNITNVAYCKSDNNGDSFNRPIMITHHLGNSGLPQISADSNGVYLLWEDNRLGNFDIFFVKSNDMGNTFGNSTNISDNAGESGTPRMYAEGQNIDVVWMDNTPGNYEILFSKSVDEGLSFSKPTDISKNEKDSGYPEFTATGNNVYVTWTNAITDKNYDIFFSKSSDGGLSFAEPVNISDNTGASGWPQIAVSRDVYVSWVDDTPGKFDIYIAKSIDDGKSFESPVNISNSQDASWYNRMQVSPNIVYMVWQEQEQTNHDVIFVKSTTFVPEFGSIASVALVIAILSIVIMSKLLPMAIRFSKN